MKKRNRDIVELYKGVELLGKTDIKCNGNLTYALSLNRRALKSTFDAIAEAEKELLPNYITGLEEINKEYVNENNEVDKLKLNEYKIKIEELNEKYKDEIKEKESLMDIETDVKIHLVAKCDFPEMPSGLADMLFLMRKENE